MDQTPRPRISGAFPGTPQTNRRSTAFGASGASPYNKRRSNPIPDLPARKGPAEAASDPLIPEKYVAAPTQRLWAFSLAVILWALRLSDAFALHDLEEQSLWLFMKWILIDGVFLFGLPGLRIPWLEWSGSTVVLLFCGHAVLDAMLMFRIAPPLVPLLGAAGRSVWGVYEIAVNEYSIKPDTVLFNESLILGRQVIHILPEGSAILNQAKEAFCIGGSHTEVRLPITINSTSPISMDLLRTDLETQANETIHISKSQIKTMHKEAARLITYSEREDEPKTLYFSVKKPGLYVLSKVVDESNLEVARKKLAHTVVAPCPKAVVLPSRSDQCRGELSDVKLEVTGTPPLTLKYRKMVDQGGQERRTFDNIVPEDFYSPLSRQNPSALILPNKVDTAWARPQQIIVPLTESLGKAGQWVYSIDSVRDGLGNTVNYTNRDHELQERNTAKSSHLHQVITVHERPTVTLNGCTPQNPMKVAKGKSTHLPLHLGSSTGQTELSDATFHLDYTFLPENDLTADGGQIAAPEKKRFVVKAREQLPPIKDAGLYTLTGVSTDFCSGDVYEPASCILQNPPEPELSLSKEEIFDKCAGSPIGLRVNLDLIGTPPFTVHYRMKRDKQRTHSDQFAKIPGLRGQIALTPQQAGHYRYEFVSVTDAVYKEQPLKEIILEQDVKPAASASFVKAGGKPKTSCIDDAVSFDVDLRGEGPFTVEYELVHGGRRQKFSQDNINDDRIEITTPPLKDGGEYTLTLASITDGMKCKEVLNDETKILVRPQRPKVGFKEYNGRRSLSILERDKASLPLRLEGGEGPWTIKYLDPADHEHTTKVQSVNDIIKVSYPGTYRLIDVQDSTCPGSVDEAASEFDVAWIPRPELRIAPASVAEVKGNVLIKNDVCEGDDDALEVLFKGSPPFAAHYTLHVKPTVGTVAPRDKNIRAAASVGLLNMETSQAGYYEYKFSKVVDENYNHNDGHLKGLTVQQRVNARPSAAFSKPGKTYSYCSVESDGEEVIPITLEGFPPFDVEFEIKHQSSARPETVSQSGINSHSHNLRIPHSRLQHGKSAITLRRISDSRGCVRPLDSTQGHVLISVHEPATITDLTSKNDFCVGDYLNFGLTGAAPFSVFYTFEGGARKAAVSSTTFRRLAEKPGTFTMTGVQDSASQCKSALNITKHIHGLPSARVSQGKDAYVDIHEGGEAEILFEFGGVPPFEFTYTRSSNTERYGKKAGVLLDMRHETSQEHSMRIKAHEEGTYEVVSIKDRYCSFSKPEFKAGNLKPGQKKLTY